MSFTGHERREAFPQRADRRGFVQDSEHTKPQEGFRPPWQMSYSELCQQPIVLYRAKHTEAEAVNGLNWIQMLNSVVPYSDSSRSNIFKVTFDNPATLAHLIAEDSLEGYFHLQRPPEHVERVTQEEREANFERVLSYHEKGIPDQVLNPLAHKKLDDGKRVVYRPLVLWIGGIRLALRKGEPVPEEIVEEYNNVQLLNDDDWDKYEAEHNRFAAQ